ncbi:MAG TPA: hypothetical protein VJN43_19515 [Bryobacteraceae bacterium]|nr:hypothetical protein [Bryobacteraceae bacterium]
MAATQHPVFCQPTPTNQPVGPPPTAPHSYDADGRYSEGLGQRWISGRVVLEDGGKLPWSVEVRTFCKVKVAGSSFSLAVPGYTGISGLGTHGGCYVTVSLPGFRSERIWAHDGIVVKLHRLGEHEGSTISVTILRAPKDAQKAYLAGRVAALRKDWPRAQSKFEKAVSIYALHAAAWDELGGVLEKKGKLIEAAAAYRRASKADPNFIKPFVHLAALAVHESHWNDAIHMAEAAISLNAVEFPQAYLYHAQAAVVLKQMETAERSAREAVRLDVEGELPLARYILAVLLDRRGERQEAREYFVQYLAMVPHAKDAAAIRERISALE